MSVYVSCVWLLFSITISTITALPLGHLGCFADLTDKSDRKTDVVIYSDKTVHACTQTKVNNQEQEFYLHSSFQAQGNVQSVSAMDFTKNGVADLFIVTENDDHYQLEVKQYPFTQPSDDQPIIQLSDKNVLILDANGDFVPDVFGKKKTSNGSEIEGFWFGNQTAKGTKFTDFVPLGIDVNNIIMETVSFIDLNQDCKADLVYMTNELEIRMISGINFQNNQAKQSDRLFELDPDREYQTRLYFADVNKDGAMDIIIPTKNDNAFKLLIQDKSQSLGFKDLCSHTKDVVFVPAIGTGITLHIKDNDDYLLKDGLSIIIQDINMDSKINIVSVLENSEGHHKVFVSTIPENAAKLEGDNMDRDMSIESAFDEYYKSEDTIKDLAFFHSGEFPLGLHFLTQKPDYSWHWAHLEPLLNDKGHGFLSICPLNDNPPTGEKKYGGTMPGVTVKAFFRSRSGKQIFLSSGSLYQTNTKNHLLPFIVFGLGDPDSYIEKLVIGYSLYDEYYVYSQPGVPPNSQLVLFAYGNRWRLETFLAPYITPDVLAVIIAVVMAILGGIWLYLEIQERKSANRDQLKSGSTTANNFFF